MKRFWSITRYFSQGNSTRTTTWQIDSAITKVSHITFCSVDFFVSVVAVLYMKFSDKRPPSFTNAPYDKLWYRIDNGHRDNNVCCYKRKIITLNIPNKNIAI